MAIRFRKSFSIVPGIKFNVGKKSASLRIGGKGLGFTAGTAGSTIAAGISGTGLSVSHKFPNKGAFEVTDGDVGLTPTPQGASGRPWGVLTLVYALAASIWWAMLNPL
jgi:hypothetical protein